MHEANDLNFARLTGGRPVFAVAGYQPGQPLPEPQIRDAKVVTLKKNAERVLVGSIKVRGDKSYVGEIVGFEPSLDIEFDGMRVGDLIAFEAAHVVGIAT